MAWLPLKAPRWQYHVDYPLWSIAVVTALYTPTETRPQQHIMYYLPDRMSLSSFDNTWWETRGLFATLSVNAECDGLKNQ